MGAALWAASSAVAFLLARIIPLGRPRKWIGELIVAIVAGMLLGVAATVMDFGGWAELDWRAGMFTFFGSVAAVGALRALQSSRS
jgi:hypothetical protein